MNWSQKTIPEPNSGCLIWLGTITSHGYGLWTDQKRKGHHVHRLMWQQKRGSIPNGLLVCHSCDNRLCCNINHLFLGTHTDNMCDMIKKGRGRNQVGGAKKPRYQGKDVVKGAGAFEWLAARIC